MSESNAKKEPVSNSRSLNWFILGSSFQKDLSQQLSAMGVDHRFRSFDWSGRNSVFAREKAAEELAETVKLDAINDPDAILVIVGHSHGGNVVLRALELFGGNLDRVRVITLATPFLRVFVVNASSNFKNLQYLMTPIIMLVVASLWLSAFSWFAQASWVRIAYELARQYDPLWALLLLSLFSFPLAGLIIRLAVNPDFRLPTEWKRKSKWRSRPQRIASAAYYSAIRSPKLLVIRGVDDEAAFALTFGTVGARLTNILMELIGRLAFTELSRIARYRAILTVGIVGFNIAIYGGIFLALFAGYKLSWLWWSLQGVLIVTYLLVIPLGLLLVALPFLLFAPGIFKAAAFGYEFLAGAGCCNLGVDSVPDTKSAADVITLAPVDHYKGSGLRHSIYRHPMCLNEIVTWLRLR